jgi:hypothetical protein
MHEARRFGDSGQIRLRELRQKSEEEMSRRKWDI